MKSDYLIQQDVQDELLWEPSLQSCEIGVAVKDGVVTLSGEVDSYSKKITAENATKRVKDVKAVAIDLEVVFPHSGVKTDADIAKAVLDALKWNNNVPDEKLSIQVENGYLKLEGELEWQYQRDAVTNAIKDLQGVRGVTNLIRLKPAPAPYLIKDNIKKALQRIANVEANNIDITMVDKTITLSGKVRSFSERAEVERAVWATPGVLSVKDELVIGV